MSGMLSVPSFLFGEVADFLRPALAFNAWSFAEMAESEVNRYAGLLRRALGSHGILVEQNHDLLDRGGNRPSEILGRHFVEIDCVSRWLRRALQGGEMRIWAMPDAWSPGVVNASIADVLDDGEWCADYPPDAAFNRLVHFGLS